MKRKKEIWFALIVVVAGDRKTDWNKVPLSIKLVGCVSIWLWYKNTRSKPVSKNCFR